MNCGQCKFLINIDISQDGGLCQLSCRFHKFYNICDLDDGFEPCVRQARWKGAGMGDYYCSLCCETVSGNRERYCPACGAEMYTDAEWERALEEFKLEDEIYVW